MSKKIAIFAPHSGIWIHAFPEAILAESLAYYGHEINYFSCNRLFSSFCSVMSSYGVMNTDNLINKEKVCQKCIEFNGIIKSNFDFNYKSINEYTDEEMKVKIKNILETVNKGNFLSLNVQDVPVGKISLYQLLLNLKKSSIFFTEDEWCYYLKELESSLFSLFCAEKIMKKCNLNVVIVYNSLYSVNNIWRHLAKNNNIDFYFLHAGGNLSSRLQTLILAKDCTFEHFRNLVKKWDAYKDKTCSKINAKKIYDHVHELLSGQHFYAYSSSSQKNQIDLYNFFNIEPTQKVFLACLSSNDEKYAAELIGVDVFSDYGLYENQISWLKDLIEYFKIRKEYSLIIRVHPREFPNKRESVLSEHTHELKKIFEDLPNNVKINWPTDNLSLYQLAMQIDVGLTSWSSAGKELSLLGLPVITYCQNSLIYTPELVYWANDKNSYFELFDTCLEKRFCLERVRRAFRWYVYEYHLSTIDISDSFDRKENEPKKIFQRLFYKVCRIIYPNFREASECKKREKKLKESSQINEIITNGLHSNLDLLPQNFLSETSLEIETENIVYHLKNLIKILYKNQNIYLQYNSLGKIILDKI